MTTEGKYCIDFAPLKDGEHHFNFTVDGSLVQDLSIIDFEDISAEVTVVLIKKHDLMTLHFKMSGSVQTTCDRCLEICTLPIESSATLYAREKRRNDDDADNLIFIDAEALSIDLTHYIYESVMVALPIKRIHPDAEDGSSTCTGEIASMVHFEEDEADADETDKPADPRWDGLKNIKFD